MIEKATDAKATPPVRYGRRLTFGNTGDPGYKVTKASCDPAEAASLTDNIEAMLAFKK